MKFYRLFLILSIALALGACHKDEPKPPTAEATRTMLVYMVASNSLGNDYFDWADLDEMEAAIASKPSDTHWLVYHASSDRNTDATLFELTPSGKKVIKTYPQGESLRSAHMKAVIAEAKKAAPARSYGLVLWSHASGWQQDGIYEAPAKAPGVATHSYGVDFGERMNVTTLRDVLKGQSFDFIYFDVCYMATVEVAYELKDVTGYIIGSASELPADGMPYDKNLPLLLKGSRSDLIAAATNTFNYFNSKPKADERTCTMAVIDTKKLDALAAATKPIYERTPLAHPGDKVTNYRGTSRQGPSIDFGEYVSALCKKENIDATLAAAFDKALSDAVIYCAATEKLWDAWPIHSSCGLSTYVFNDAKDFTVNGYSQLAWAKNVAIHHLPK